MPFRAPAFAAAAPVAPHARVFCGGALSRGAAPRAAARPRARVVACADKPEGRYRGVFSRPPASEGGQAGQEGGKAEGEGEQGEGEEGGVEKGEGEGEGGVRPWWRRLAEDAKYDDLRTFGVSFAIALLVRTVVVEPRFIPSESMVPTFEVGDQLLVEKVSKYVRRPHAGDVVVFMPPPALVQRGYSERDAFIKRVVGAEGDTVRVARGHVELNGVAQPEPYIAALSEYEWGPATVPPGYVMVLGDNRNNSFDSHVWGFLPTSNIIGRAMVRYWPPTRVGGELNVPSMSPGGADAPPARPDVSPLSAAP